MRYFYDPKENMLFEVDSDVSKEGIAELIKAGHIPLKVVWYNERDLLNSLKEGEKLFAVGVHKTPDSSLVFWYKIRVKGGMKRIVDGKLIQPPRESISLLFLTEDKEAKVNKEDEEEGYDEEQEDDPYFPDQRNPYTATIWGSDIPRWRP
jgi:DNA replicative helicase MCM subunit Mcm2 (Cdc46/Mcm family)